MITLERLIPRQSRFLYTRATIIICVIEQPKLLDSIRFYAQFSMPPARHSTLTLRHRRYTVILFIRAGVLLMKRDEN